MTIRLFALLVVVSVLTPDGFTQGDPATVSAVRDGNLEALQEALNARVNPDEADENGATALMWAAYKGDMDAARVLVEAGAAVDSIRGTIWLNEAQTWGMGSPLVLAAYHGHQDMVRYLIDGAGADMNRPGWDDEGNMFKGITPIIAALWGDHASISRMLIDAGVDPPLQDGGIYAAAETMPELVGGIERLSRRIHYPETARRRGIEGRVFVRFVVRPDGTPTDIQVMRGIGGGCDEEAVAAVRASRFTPAVYNGARVPIRMSLPVTFRLN